MKQRKWLIAGAIAVVIVIIVIVAVTRGGNNAVAVTTAKVTARTVQSSVLASGKFAYKDQVELRPQVAGQIVSIPIEAGDPVKTGEVVLRIDPKTYQANVAEQQAQVALQHYAINQASLKLANLKREWERKTKLYKQGLIDANSYDALTNEYHVAGVALSSAKESLSVAEAQLQYAQEQLAKTVVRAPLSGVVIALPMKVGESVIPSTTNIPGSSLMTIGDPTELLAEVNVDEADIAHLALGETAEVTSTAYPNDALKGKVSFVAPAATTMPGQQGQGFLVKLRLPNPKQIPIRPDMSCRAEIFTQSAKNAIAVPVGAVLFSDQAKPAKALFSTQGAYVLVDDGGTAKRRDVTLGISSDTWQEIKSGLKAGEEVITGPYAVLQSLAPGASVRAETPAPNAASG